MRRAERAVLLRWFVEAYSPLDSPADSRRASPDSGPLHDSGQHALHLSAMRSVLQRMQVETTTRGGGASKAEGLIGSVAQAVKAAVATKKNMGGVEEEEVTV